MAKLINPRKPKETNHLQRQNEQNQKAGEKTHSWAAMRNLLTRKQPQQPYVDKNHSQQGEEEEEAKAKAKATQRKQKQKQLPEEHQLEQQVVVEETSKTCKKMRCSGSICSNTKVMHRPEVSNATPETSKRRSSKYNNGNSNIASSSSRSMKVPLVNGMVSSAPASSSSSTSLASPSSNNNTPSIAGSFRGMPFRRFSGCYECKMVVDPILGFAKDPSLRSTICSCPECGQVFMKPENLELHQAVRHAVSELSPEDTSKNIVEIIFQSSWLKKQTPICTIDRILKVHNTQRTISKFEEYRDSIKTKAIRLPKKHPRCIADGNELLRFHCTTFTCSLGLNGSSNLCSSIPHCNICSIIKNGFKVASEGDANGGILTTATSGKAHDRAGVSSEHEKRAMLVCRVIAGRVKKNINMEGIGNMEDYDSTASTAAGLYSNLDELYVFNPKAILPCFVVIYRWF